MNIEILEVNVQPLVRYKCDKKGNRWNSIGDHDFRFRVACKLKIDGKTVQACKETKHFEMDTSSSFGFRPSTISFAIELLRKMNVDFSKLTNDV